MNVTNAKMNVTTDNFINNILLEGLYLSLWVCFLAISIYRQQILIKEIDRLKKKQDILFESIQKLKIIIDIDKETEDIVSANVAILQNKLNDIEKRIEESESEEDRGVRGFPVEESESEEDRGVRGFPVEESESAEDRGVRGFPVEESESAEDRGVRGLGTQVPVEESYVDKYRVNPVKDMGFPHYIKYLDHDLKNLFGIFSDDDNETTADTLSTYLEPQSYLEPHLSFEKN